MPSRSARRDDKRGAPMTEFPHPAPIRPALSVVAPCYNEEAVLPEFVARVGAVLDGLGHGDPSSAEIVLVDDGSRDGTWAAMTAAAARDSRVVAVQLMRNHGHQLALTAGLSICRGERILIIDADLQDPPELLPEMMAVMERQDADVVADLVIVPDDFVAAGLDHRQHRTARRGHFATNLQIFGVQFDAEARRIRSADHERRAVYEVPRGARALA